jgi:predicted DNA-binding protein (MmcQ/YjbR family)
MGTSVSRGTGGRRRAASRRFVNDVAVEPELLDRATNICLALPEATADDRHPPHRGFLVGKKNFAWFVVDEHGDGRIGLGVRAAPGENEELVATDPERFGLPKYVARHGWVTYYLDLPGRPVDWDEVAELVQESYIIQAPTRLARLLDD